MRSLRFAVLLLAGCASGPAPVNYQPCPQGQRFSEATPAGGRGVLKIVEGSHIASVFGRDVMGKGNVDRDQPRTGGPMPGSAPRLDAVDLDYDTLVAGQKTGGVARLRGTHPPLTLIAASNSFGYGWVSSAITQTEIDLDFAVGCRSDRHPQVVRWRFSVKDSYGRVSNVIEKPVHCGLCVAR